MPPHRHTEILCILAHVHTLQQSKKHYPPTPPLRVQSESLRVQSEDDKPLTRVISLSQGLLPGRGTCNLQLMGRYG